jgi:MFS family permease
MPQLRSGFVALSIRNYRLYWSGQIVSLVGTWMQSVSQPWLVLLLGGSPIQLGIVLALQFAPSMVLAPLGGVIADRVDKRRLLALFVLTATDVVQIWHVMLLALALGFVNAVDMPVRQSFAADLVSRDQLMGAITLNSASFNLARVLGPAVAGVTLAVFGPAFNFAINAASYGGVLTALWRMDPHEIRRAARPERQPSVRSSLAEGIRYAVRTPTVLWPLVLLGGVSLFGFNFQILLPLFARLTLEMRADGYGALFAAMGLGSLIGSLSLAFIGTRRPLLGFILGGGLGFVVFEALLGLARSPFLVYPLIMLVGLSSMLMINSINVMVQQNVPNELRGRVMALYVTVFAGASPIGGIFVGVVAELWGAPAGFLLGAALSALFLALIAWQLLFLGKGRTDEPISPASPATPAAA